MLLVRLRVFCAVAALALASIMTMILVTMHTELEEPAFSKRVCNWLFSLGITQGLFRLGSGAFIYPRTSRSLRANTLAPTAPPYTYGSDTFLGYARLNIPSMPNAPSGRRQNDGTLNFQQVPSLRSVTLYRTAMQVQQRSCECLRRCDLPRGDF